MDTQHYIRRVGGGAASLGITGSEFEGIATARQKLGRVSSIDNKFVMLLENFIEFDSELHSLALRFSVYRNVDWFEFQDAIFTVNRRLLNLVAACCQYRDQTQRDVDTLFGKDSPVSTAFELARNKEFDDTIGYRMMEGLRNHIQHHDIAVQHLGFPGSRHDLDDGVVFVYGIEPSIYTSEVRRNTHLNAKVRETLNGLPDLVCITPWVRQYVEGLGRVHSALHTAMSEAVNAWHTTLTSTLERARTELGNGSYLVVREGADPQEVQLFTEFLKRRERQQRRTSHLSHLTKTLVTSSAAVTPIKVGP